MTTNVSDDLPVDADALREEVKKKYREVATDPHGPHHFHTCCFLARHLGYDEAIVSSLPDVAVESFAGVANPFSLRPLGPPIDTFKGASGESKARLFEVNGFAFLVTKYK